MEDTPEFLEMQEHRKNLQTELTRISNEIDLSRNAIRFEIERLDKASLEIKKILELNK